MNHKALKIALLAVLLTGLAGCATTSTERVKIDPVAAEHEEKRQREIYVKRSARDQKHVQTLAQPLILGSAHLCDEDVSPYVGFVAVNVEQWPKNYQEAARSVLGVHDEMSIGIVVPGSPADDAGLLKEDILTMIADKHIPLGKKGTKNTAKLIENNLTVGVPTVFTIERAGEEIKVPVTPVAACNYNIAMVADDQVNAFADGNNIYITSGMLRFTESDLELQTVLAHELAHNAMGHIDKKMTNYLLGSIFDVVAAAYGVNTQGAFGNSAANAYSQDYEAEADYIGMYVMALAGLDIDEAADFWRRMGSNSPGAIETQYNGTHPGTAERYLALEEIDKEITAKIESDEPLVPRFKKDKKEKD